MGNQHIMFEGWVFGLSRRDAAPCALENSSRSEQNQEQGASRVFTMRRALATAGRRLSRCLPQDALVSARRDVVPSAPHIVSLPSLFGGGWERAVRQLGPTAGGLATSSVTRGGYATSSRCPLKGTANVADTSATAAADTGEEPTDDGATRWRVTEDDPSEQSGSGNGVGPAHDPIKSSSPSRSSSDDTVSVWTTTPEADHTWVDQMLPSSMVPYAKLVRLDRPIGTYLLAWPCFWSVALAAPAGALPDAYMLSLFGAGSLLLRGAGCTVNDLWDRDIDKLVARTRNRPIASGAVSPLSALVFLSGQLGAGLIILLQLNDFSKVLGASSLGLVAVYPLMKRITNWPQAFLGLTFNWGALLGWAAVHGSLEPTVVLPLYASGALWTLLYDTIYAHQDKADDIKVGVKSTALHFGGNTKTYLAGFGGLSIAALCASGAAAGVGWPFYAGLGAAASHLAWQVADVDLDDRDDCAAKFKSNSVYGGIVFAAIVAGKLSA